MARFGKGPYMTYSGPSNPRILIVGEAWGADEARIKKPFIGASGQELWRMLGQALPDIAPLLHCKAAELCQPRYGFAWVSYRDDWLNEASIGFTNVFNEHPPNNLLDHLCTTKPKGIPNKPPLKSGKYISNQHQHHLDRLLIEIETLKPNIVVAAGNSACWALLNSTGITALRGTTSWSHWANIKTLPTFHPAYIIHEGGWEARPILISDLIKASKEAESPAIIRPPRDILINPSLAEVKAWTSYVLNNSTARLSVDIETSGGIIDTIGFSCSPKDALVIPFGVHRQRRGTGYVVTKPRRDGVEVTSYWTPIEEREVWLTVGTILASPIPKVFQNGTFDLQYLIRMGFVINNIADDTMLAWHALFPEMPKSLAFLGSVLTNESAWKLLARQKSDTQMREK